MKNATSGLSFNLSALFVNQPTPYCKETKTQNEQKANRKLGSSLNHEKLLALNRGIGVAGEQQTRPFIV